MPNFLQKNPMVAYGLMAFLVVLIIVVLYYYYSSNQLEKETYTAGVRPVKLPEMMTAAYLPDSRSDREGMTVQNTLRQYGLPVSGKENMANMPGAPLPYSTENVLYRKLHSAASRADTYRS